MTDPHDVTLLYNDIGVGYFVYRDADPDALVSSVAPTFETHVNVPLNHRGAFRFNDPAGTADVVDLTYGVNVLFRRRTLLPLDDVLGCLRESIPTLTRSALHRCLVRHGISRLPKDEEKTSKRRRFAETLPEE